MKKTVLAALLSLAASSAMAWTVGVDMGRADVDGADHETAYRLSVSHPVHSLVKVEAAYMRSDDFDGVDVDSFDLSALGVYPLSPDFSLTGRLGVSRTFAELAGNTDAAWTPVYGVGLDYRIDREWSASFAVDRYHDFADSDEHLDLVSVGLKYSF